MLFKYSITLVLMLKYMYTGCPRRNGPDFERGFLMVKYTDITENTYVQSLTFTEIMAREKVWSSGGSMNYSYQLRKVVSVYP
jgi:hypothetical protein